MTIYKIDDNQTGFHIKFREFILKIENLLLSLSYLIL